MGRREVGGGQGEIKGCQYQETVWIEVQVGMLFQIDSRHGRRGIRKFVYDTDRSTFLKQELVGFGVDK